MQKINDFLNGGTYAVISTLILIFALFADDVRQIWFPVSADLTFTILTLLCMIYYLVEIVILSLVQVNSPPLRKTTSSATTSGSISSQLSPWPLTLSGLPSI